MGTGEETGRRGDGETQEETDLASRRVAVYLFITFFRRTSPISLLPSPVTVSCPISPSPHLPFSPSPVPTCPDPPGSRLVIRVITFA